MKIFSGSSNKPLAQQIAKVMRANLSPLEIFVFPDGERRIKANDGVVDKDTIIIQSTSTPVDQNYMELFLIADSMKRSGARFVTAVIPYFGYQRQDHVFRDGEAVSLEVCIKMVESVGIDRVVALDLHSIKIPEIFSISMTHLSALPLFAQTLKQHGWDKTNSVLVTPDMGGIRRMKQLARLMSDMPYVAVVKDRNLDTGQIASGSFGNPDETERENISDEEVHKKSVRKVQGKRAIIVDDMASSGKTLVKAAQFLKRNGAKDSVAFATHAVFSKDAPKLLQESILSEVFVTDSVFVPEEKKFAKLTIVSIAEMVAKALK